MDPVVIKRIENCIKIGYSGKVLGNTNPRFSPDADKNFARFTSHFPGLDICDMKAKGGDNIVNVDSLSQKEARDIEADAFITTKTTKLLVLKAADCIPVVLYSPGQRILGLLHAGTTSAALHLPTKIIKKLGLKPETIHCYIGPFVSQKSYRFPDNDISNKQLNDSWRPYITHESDGTHINLLGYVIDELKGLGIQQENIKVENIDTGSDPGYYSHRRHRITGEEPGRNCFGVCLID